LTRRRRAYLLAAYADFCIRDPEAELPDWGLTPLGQAVARGRVAGGCTLEDLRKALQQRDPLDRGFSDRWGLQLISSLLEWNPLQRIKPAEVGTDTVGIRASVPMRWPCFSGFGARLLPGSLFEFRRWVRARNPS
jgi:hypothetical protein